MNCNITFDIEKLESYNQLKLLIRDTMDGSSDVVTSNMTVAEIDVALTDIGLIVEAFRKLHHDLKTVYDAMGAAERSFCSKVAPIYKRDALIEEGE